MLLMNKVASFIIDSQWEGGCVWRSFSRSGLFSIIYLWSRKAASIDRWESLRCTACKCTPRSEPFKLD
jgi:hypothetical protein